MLIFSNAFPRNMSDNFYHATTAKSFNCVVDPVCSYPETFEPCCSKDFPSEAFNDSNLKHNFVSTSIEFPNNLTEEPLPLYTNSSDTLTFTQDTLPTSGEYCNNNPVKTKQSPEVSTYLNLLNTVPNNEVSSSNLIGVDSDQSELELYKQWLLLHTDLIQQQNDDIIEKDKQISFLKKENFLLKEKLKCLENSISIKEDTTEVTDFKPNSQENSPKHPVEEEKSDCASFKDMTEDSCNSFGKEEIEVVDSKKEDFVNCTLEVIHFGSSSAESSDKNIESQTAAIIGGTTSSTSKQETCKSEPLEVKSDYFATSLPSTSKVDTVYEFNPFKSSKMNMRQRRVDNGSGSDTVTVKNRDRRKRAKRRSKSSSKTSSSEILTTKEPYINQVNSDNNGILEQEALNAAKTSTLEVPSWRIKLYSSLYTMEGTENIEDEVYNKRHSRLENDERRRKRWDIQRIREQRIIEKLKQRQEKPSSVKSQTQEVPSSLWPKPEDIRFIEVTEDLPVAAFGHPLPKNIIR